MFWVFAFPILMTCALGRRVSIERRGAGHRRRRADAGERGRSRAALERAGGFTVRPIEPDEVERAVRDGRAPVVVIPGTPPSYHFDAARAESQAARLAVDAALQRAAGRRDAFQPVERPVEAIGSRYIDWLVPACSA